MSVWPQIPTPCNVKKGLFSTLTPSLRSYFEEKHNFLRWQIFFCFAAFLLSWIALTEQCEISLLPRLEIFLSSLNNNALQKPLQNSLLTNHWNHPAGVSQMTRSLTRAWGKTESNTFLAERNTKILVCHDAHCRVKQAVSKDKTTALCNMELRQGGFIYVYP